MFKLTVCDCGNAVGHAKTSLPSRDSIDSAAEIFKICGDPTRVGILCALCSHRLCVCEIASVLDMTSSATQYIQGNQRTDRDPVCVYRCGSRRSSNGIG